MLIEEVSKLANQITADPESQIHLITEVVKKISSLTLMPTVVLEQVLAAEEATWGRVKTELKAEGAEEEAERARNQNVKILRLFLEKVQPVLVEIFKEAGVEYHTFEELTSVIEADPEGMKELSGEIQKLKELNALSEKQKNSR